MLFAILTLFLLAFTFAAAWYDARLLRAHKWIDQAGHLLRWLIRAWVVFTGVLAATGAAPGWWEYLPYMAVLFWIVFDPLLNLLRGLPDWFTHLGKSAWLDRIFPAIGYQWLTKIALLAGSIYLLSS